MRPKQGPGACGARPLSRHYTTPYIFPGGGVVARAFFGGRGPKFPPGVPYLRPSLSLYLPRAPHKFSPVCPLFSVPRFSLYKFSPKIFPIYPPFFLYI